MQNKNILGVISFSLIAVLGISMISAFGFGDRMNFNLSDEERTEMQAQHEAMQNAIETGNYAEWEALMQERIALAEDRINPEVFSEIQERHQQREQIRDSIESGDFETAQQLKEQFGIEEKGLGMKRGPGHDFKDFGNCKSLE